MKFISVKPCLIQNQRKSRYSVFLFYFQELPVEVFHPPHVIDTCTLYIYEVHRSLRKENAFSFSFRKQIFLQIFPSVFCFVPSSHIFGMQLNWGFHIRVHLPFALKYERVLCTWPIVQGTGGSQAICLRITYIFSKHNIAEVFKYEVSFYGDLIF